MVRALDSQSRDPRFKTTGGSKVDSAFQPSEVDQMSTRTSCPGELVVKSKVLKFFSPWVPYIKNGNNLLNLEPGRLSYDVTLI